MTIEADKGLRGLRNVRRRYDDLLRDYGGKRPTNYAKMREFLLELMQIVDEETTDAGLAPSPVLDIPDPAVVREHTPKAVKNKGAVVLRTRAELDREKAKKNPPKPKAQPKKNVFVDDPKSFKLRDELEEAAKKKAEEEVTLVEKDSEARLNEDPNAKGLSEEALAQLDA